MMKGIRLVGICRNLRDMTSQNFPASLINHTGCIGFQSEALGLVADGVRKIVLILSVTKPRTSDWKSIDIP